MKAQRLVNLLYALKFKVITLAQFNLLIKELEIQMSKLALKDE